jgi:uncharacterized repeat protein (TIGR01451 family)
MGLSLAWILGAQVNPGSAAPGAELHVCLSGCTYDTVQEAVDAASEGDFIKVAEGTYTGVSQRDGVTQTVYLSKTLTIYGGYTTSDWDKPEPEINITTLDAQGLGRVFFMKGGITPTIAGLHITGGNALGLGPNGEGGGIYTYNEAYVGAFNTTLKDNHLYNNKASDGGGAYLDGHAHHTLTGNTFELNLADDRGGGLVIFNQPMTLTHNTFSGNSAAYGGGLAVLNADALLQGNRFQENSALEAGGGVFAQNSAFEAEGDVLLKNSAGRGGGLAVFGAFYNQTWRDNWVVNTVVAYNESSVEGSGIYIGGSPLHLWHTTLVSNTGGGDPGIGIIIGDWFTGQTSEVELRNTILVSQTTGIAVEDGSTVAIDSILWYADAITLTEVPEADVSIVNQFTGDPAFTDPALADFHLEPTSAARDVGMLSGVAADFDGWVRPMGMGYDLGAFEHHDAALSLSKTPHLSGANVGAELTYQVVLTSAGAGDSDNVVFTDTLDAWQRPMVVDSPDGNCTIEDPDWGGTVVCQPGDLNLGDVIEAQVTVEVNPFTPLGQELINTVTARAGQAANTIQSVVYAQDCHVRIGDSPTGYASVQDAVDAAYPYALVKVAGTCMGVVGPQGARQQVLLERTLTIQGGYTTANWTTPDPEANLTTLDARGQGRVLFINTQTPGGTLIDGLHITGGNSTYQLGGHSPFDRYGSRGGGVYVFGSDPTFSNDHIYGNIAPEEGGGMANSFCNCTIRDSIFSDNTSLKMGGGLAVHAGGTELFDTLFEGNRAENGGGFAAATMGGGHFFRNTFIDNHASGFGGGLALETAALLNETVILSNTAAYGGGIAFFEGINPFSPFAVLTNTVIADNQATLEGAGMFIPSGGAVKMLHTTLARNTGGDDSGITLGWYDWMSPGVSSLAMTDTIVAYQEVGIQVSDLSTVTVGGVLWFANPTNVSHSDDATVWLWNEHTGDPLFVNPDGSDYHIGEDSAARNAGIPSDVTWDLDYELRPMGGTWDLGADEFFELWFFLPMTAK